jgi:hypothetical protein
MHHFYCFSRVAYVMDLRGWEYLWKILATIGVVNFFFVVTIILPPPLGNVRKLRHVMRRFQVITS